MEAGVIDRWGIGSDVGSRKEMSPSSKLRQSGGEDFGRHRRWPEMKLRGERLMRMQLRLDERSDRWKQLRCSGLGLGSSVCVGASGGRVEKRTKGSVRGGSRPCSGDHSMGCEVTGEEGSGGNWSWLTVRGRGGWRELRGRPEGSATTEETRGWESVRSIRVELAKEKAGSGGAWSGSLRRGLEEENELKRTLCLIMVASDDRARESRLKRREFGSKFAAVDNGVLAGEIRFRGLCE